MVDILFEVNGRKVDPGSMRPGLQRAMLATYREALAERVGNLRCERHGAIPTLLCKGPSAVDLSLEVCGCCDHLVDQVRTRLH